MIAEEIAEALFNGDAKNARKHIVRAETGRGESAVLALDVVGHLASKLKLYSDAENYAAALVRVRRCVEGGV